MDGYMSKVELWLWFEKDFRHMKILSSIFLQSSKKFWSILKAREIFSSIIMRQRLLLRTLLVSYIFNLSKRKVFGAFFLVCSGVAHNRSFETAAAEDSNALAAVDSSPFFHTVAIAALLVEKHKWRRSIYPSTAAELLSDDGRSEERRPPPQKPSIVAVFHPCWNERWCRVLCVVFTSITIYASNVPVSLHQHSPPPHIAKRLIINHFTFPTSKCFRLTHR